MLALLVEMSGHGISHDPEAEKRHIAVIGMKSLGGGADRVGRFPSEKVPIPTWPFKCARRRGYMREFDLCRICFREMANEGQLPGITKSSW